MSDDKWNIFVKIKKQDELNQLIQSLNKEKYEIAAKLPTSAEDMISLIPESLMRLELGCRIKLKPKDLQIPESGTIVIQVQMGDEKYLAQPNYTTRSGSLYLQLDCDFFQLQRREDFRLRIPSSYKSEIKITSRNEQVTKLSGNLLDISSGGCRFENHRRNFPVAMNDIIKGQISFAGRPSVDVMGIIRHIAPLPDNPEVDLIGVQFQDLTAQSKNRIFALIMDIHRELFTKLR